MPDSAREAISRSSERGMQCAILGASAREIHDVGPHRTIDPAERGTTQAEDRAWKGPTIRVGGIKTVAGKIDNAGAGDAIDVALRCSLRLRTRCQRENYTRSCKALGDCRVRILHGRLHRR